MTVCFSVKENIKTVTLNYLYFKFRKNVKVFTVKTDMFSMKTKTNPFFVSYWLTNT